MRRRSQAKSRELDRKAAFAAWELPPATAIELQLRHGFWKDRRARVRQLLANNGTGNFALARWDCCGSDSKVEYSKSEDRYRVRANHCKCRHCEPCMRAKAAKIASNLRSHLAKIDRSKLRFLTLTLKHSDTPLIDQVKKLYRCFRLLRSWKKWKHSQDGGVATLEVKWNGTHWHPHLHIIIEGRWLSGWEISDQWKNVTGDSFICDIEAIDNKEMATKYVTKYITKAVDLSVWSDDAAASEWIVASKGVRICTTFGTWRGVKLTATPKTAEDWKPIASVTRIVEAAQLGEAWALGILKAIDKKLTFEVSHTQTPPPEIPVL